MSTLARLDHVTRRFGDVTALDDVSLEIGAGRIVGLLGPNGAGKSTLLSLLQGQRRPTSGTVELLGGNPTDARYRRGLGCTPQETALPPVLRVGEVIDLVSAHFENPMSKHEIAEEFGFSDLLRRQTGSLSGGQKRRVSVALAFVSRPKLVLLDEPTTGLDVDARRTLWEAVRRQHAAGATVVITSHYLEEIEALAQRVVVMHEGRILADGDLADVIGQVGVKMLNISTPHPDAVSALSGVVDSRDEDDGSHTFFVHDADATVVELVRSGIPFSGLGVRGATLEEAFLTITAPQTESPAGSRAQTNQEVTA